MRLVQFPRRSPHISLYYHCTQSPDTLLNPTAINTPLIIETLLRRVNDASLLGGEHSSYDMKSRDSDFWLAAGSYGKVYKPA